MRNINPEVLDILNKSTIIGNVMNLPILDLPKTLRKKLNKTINKLGGQYHTGIGGFLFPPQKIQKLNNILTNPVQNHSPKQLTYPCQSGGCSTAKFKVSSIPILRAIEMVEAANIQKNELVLEPSAGNGDLAIQAAGLGAKLVCYEITTEGFNNLQKMPFQEIFHADFLSIAPVERFDKVITFPPSLGGQDCTHITHSMKFLKKDGVLIGITTKYWQNFDDKVSKDFRELFTQYKGEIVKTFENGDLMIKLIK